MKLEHFIHLLDIVQTSSTRINVQRIMMSNHPRDEAYFAQKVSDCDFMEQAVKFNSSTC